MALSLAGLLVPGKMERMNKALLADSGAIFAGSLLGTSSTTAYVESAAGVQAGGRTGLTAVVVAVLFLASPGQRTIPRQMWSGIREQISPTILAVATLLVLLSIVLLTVIELLRRRSERLRGVTPS